MTTLPSLDATRPPLRARPPRGPRPGLPNRTARAIAPSPNGSSFATSRSARQSGAAPRRSSDAFERENPGVRVELQVIPNASDLAHQLLVTALGAGRTTSTSSSSTSSGWPSSRARGGSPTSPTRSRPSASARSSSRARRRRSIARGRTRAVPWYVDVGLLYYRTDLVPRAAAHLRGARARGATRDGAAPGARRATCGRGASTRGSRCNFFEALWGRGGDALDGERLAPRHARRARGARRRCARSSTRGVSPPSVHVGGRGGVAPRCSRRGARSSCATGRTRGRGLQEAGSPVRGTVGVAPLPTRARRARRPGALGGWQLGVSAAATPPRDAPRRRGSSRTSPRRRRTCVLALAYGRNPARRAAYDDPRARRAARPFIAGLLPARSSARGRGRSRPTTCSSRTRSRASSPPRSPGSARPPRRCAARRRRSDAIAGVPR